VQAPRPVFVFALCAAALAGTSALVLPRVARALPRAQAAVPAAREALQQSVPEAARALGLAERPAPAPAPAPEAQPGVAAAGFATHELGGFTVPHFAAMAGRDEALGEQARPGLALPRWSGTGR
jgi:hypothetical protein